VDFALTAEQQKRYDKLLSDVRLKADGSRQAPGEHLRRADWQAVAGLGLVGLCLPAQFGGGGLGALDTALCLEAFGRGCTDTGLAFAVAAHLLACGVPVRDYASDQVKARLLSGMCSGAVIAANAITEDGAGSDVSALQVTARREGDSYVLDGEKSFASNAPIADVIVTYAVTDASAGYLGITGFAVPSHAPGLTVGPPLEKMGLSSCPAARVRFVGCRVPAALRLGEEGQGSAIFQHSMGWERACLPAIYLGMMERQLEQCVTHARERRQFGRGIGQFQAISHRLARMKQRLESARLLLYRGCWLMDAEGDFAAAVALSKTAVAEAAVANSEDAIQVFGGLGYLRATGIEQNLRDSVPAAIFSGTTEIQRDLIAREMGL
jgi:L-prolyl-[peptidyl-carrier protein] dehydrogenase